MNVQQLWVGQAWDGRALESPAAELRLWVDAGHLLVSSSAPRRGDPPPPSLGAPPGRYPELWRYEVVECFLLGDTGQYLELEWNPHGHWLAIRLEGVRKVLSDDLSLDTRIHAESQRWEAVTRIHADHLPPGLSRVNAFAIHGLGSQRRYCAHVGAPGDRPDFHRLEHFVKLDAVLLEALGPCGRSWR